MARYIDPVPQYLDSNGEPLVNAKLYFFKSGTNTPLATFADKDQTIPNTHPVELNAAADVPNVFYSGSAKVILTYDKPELSQFGIQRWERDPVGGENELGNFELHDNSVIYDRNDITQGSDGKFYLSLIDGNQGNDPTTSPESWEEIRFIGVWNTNINYSVGDVVQTSEGYLWRSVIGGNISNDPNSDDGTNWAVAINDDLVLEEVNTVIPQTGGGTLTALRTNELRDGLTYTLPSASSINADQTITITQPDEYVINEPLVQADGADTITDKNGSDTEILFNQSGSVVVTLTSDGISNWGL